MSVHTRLVGIECLITSICLASTIAHVISSAHILCQRLLWQRRLLAGSAEFVAANVASASGGADDQQQQRAAALVLALLGQLFSNVSSARSAQMDIDADDDHADAVEELTEFWLRTVGIVTAARQDGNAVLMTAVARSKWLQHLRPALAQLRGNADLDERLTEALQSLMA